jgi:hypothetical protein
VGAMPRFSGSTVVSAESQPAREYDATVAEYHTSRARYIRTVTSGVEMRLMETVGKRREPLTEEISNLSILAHDRYDMYQAALKAYASKAPNRVTAGGLLPPSPTERMIRGIDKLYNTALKAAEECREVNTNIKKRKDKLVEMDWKLREQVEQYGHALIAQLETTTGLEGAFKRDPLLGRAHARMLAAEARRTSIRDSASSLDPLLTEGVMPLSVSILPVR